MTDDHAENARQSAHTDRGPDAGAAAPSSDRRDPGPVAMGPLEFATYRRLWRSSASFRHHLAATAERKRSIRKTENQSAGLVHPVASDSGASPRPKRLAAPRDAAKAAERNGEKDYDSRDGARPPELFPTSPARAAAALLFARIFDERPDLLHSTRSAAPTIVIDIADPEMLGHVAAAWQDVLFDDPSRLTDIGSDSACYRSELDAAYLVVKEPSKAAQKDQAERSALRALSLALPVIAISPMAKSHLPDALNKAATARIEFPRLDATVIARVIRLITGRPCREAIGNAGAVARTSPSDLGVAVRFDRTPSQCVAGLRRLAAATETKKGARELTLSDLHGLGEARIWAEAAISDIKAWKDGRIPWSEVPSGIALSGPPGCGKTTFAAVSCQEAGLHMVSATLAKWQSSGEAHLGHLLRAMRQDFEEARANVPSCVFVDEIDSFPDRAGITHAWRDYVVEVVNALLAEIDGIKGREGVIVIGASNDIGRCDPALLRAGRLERIVSIGLPDVAELERMFRVRLRGALKHEDLSSIVELAIGMVGADVERVVRDGRRTARQDGGRAITLGDLRNALAVEDDRPIEQRWRTCVHEASHLVADVIHFGPNRVFATTARVGARGGMSVRTDAERFAGTPDAYRRRLQVILAGRAGEKLLLGSVSHGAGGAPGSDLEKATSLAAAMVASLGLVGPRRLTYFGPSRDTAALLAFAEVRKAVARELADAADAATSLLRTRRPAVEDMARQLLERGRVSGMEAAKALRLESEACGTRKGLPPQDTEPDARADGTTSDESLRLTFFSEITQGEDR